MSLTYSDYLRLDALLALQEPRSDDHDEMLFIVIHQVYELWFKEILHELDRLRELFFSPPGTETAADVLHALKRTLTILKTMVAQVDILETMTPISFASFRTRLDTASGFQSPQFREVEFLLGLRDRAMLRHHRENPAALARLERRLGEASLYQALLAHLRAAGYAIPAELLLPGAFDAPPESAAARAAFVEVYRRDHGLTAILERMVDLDEGLQEWRYRHVKMVERTIGSKPGTGGSPGAAYLKQTLFRAVFPDLWTIRSEL